MTAFRPVLIGDLEIHACWTAATGIAAGSSNEGGEVTCSDPESGGLSGRMSAKRGYIVKKVIECPSPQPDGNNLFIPVQEDFG